MIRKTEVVSYVIDTCRYWLYLLAILVIISVLMGSCASQAETAARRAAIEQERRAKEEAKQEVARQAEIIKLLNMRKALPCDSSQVKPGKVIYLPGITLPCPEGKDSVKCPPCQVNTPDTVFIADPALTAIVRDSLKSAEYWHKRYQDSTNKMIASISKQNAEYKKGSDNWDKLVSWLLAGAGLLAAGGIVFAFFKMKSKIGL
jgi:hypothetical protein